MYTFRSAVEAYQTCPRYRYNQYHLNDQGVVPVAQSVPLVTGSAVHKGVEHLMNQVRIGTPPDVEVAVQLATWEYSNSCEKAGFRGKGTTTDRQQLYTFEEQKALVEGLIRAWYLRELPWIIKGYKVIAVEREIEPIEIVPGVLWQTRVDAELQDLESKDYYNYSLKTAKAWNEKNETSYGRDLQGLTEIWAVEEDARRREENKVTALDSIEFLLDGEQFGNKNLAAIKGYLEKASYAKRVMGVKFCILIKGIRKKPDYYGNDDEALYITYSPLVRGYKHFTPGGVEYAHSWFYPNSENKSGKSALGKGWEPFNVWEMEGGVKRWVEMLESGAIQPECGDVLKAQVVTPVEMFRDEGEITEAIEEVRLQEERIACGLTVIAALGPRFERETLARTFPHARKCCDWMYGETCEYKKLCWDAQVKNDPVGSGLYQIREPHHELR